MTEKHDNEVLHALISAQAAEIAALREALKPFADAAEHIPSPRNPDHFGVHILYAGHPTIGDLRRAASAMESKP